MTDWLRPGFLRSRTPISLVPRDRTNSLSHEESTCSEDGGLRLRPVSRVSSYIGFRPVTPPQITDSHQTFPVVRDPESVYYRPSGDQMAEALKVVMMNQSSTTPIPLEYNSCVLHVLEAYQDLRTELDRKHVFIEKMESSHAKDISCFEGLASQWELKESAYKADLKQVEILLSQTEGGMEKVSMARSKSTVHGTQNIGKAIGRELGTMRKLGVQSNAGNSEITRERPRDTLERDNNQIKHRPTSVKTQQNAITDTRGRVPYRLIPPQPSSASLHEYTYKAMAVDQRQSHSPPEQSSGFTRAQLEALDRQVEQELLSAFKSTSARDSVKSSLTTDSAAGQLSHLGPSLEDDPSTKILARLEATISSPSDIIQVTNDESGSDISLDNEVTAGQMSFSFYPGDDSNLLTEDPTSNVTLRTRLATHLSFKTTATREQRYGELCTTNDGVDNTQRKARRNTKSETTLMTGVLAKRKVQHRSDPLNREDSSSSVVTAVRDCASPGSNNSSIRDFKNMGTSTSSVEAVTAASKAFGGRKQANSEAGSKSHVKKKGSG